MPRQPSHGHDAVNRMVRILRYLGDHGRRASSNEIREGIPEYRGDTGNRMFRRDLRNLRERGLVRTGVPGFPRSTGIELCTPMKPTDLHLTNDEHEALSRLRSGISQRAAGAEVVEAGGTWDLTRAVRLMRYMEEHPNRQIASSEVARAIRISMPELAKLLKRVRDEDDWVLQQREGLLLALSGLEMDADDDRTPNEPPAWLEFVDEARALGNATLDPRQGTGQLGCFAYTEAEAEDRLAVIDDALDDPSIDAPTVHLLESASGKLRDWLAHLQSLSGGRLS